MENVTLEENGEKYLDNLNFSVMEGEVMGGVVADYKGYNQLLTLICQNRPVSFGRVYFDGKMVNHYARTNRYENRVYMIEERSRLIDSLTVSDNLFVMRKGFRKYLLNRKVLDEQADILVRELGVTLNVDRCAGDLSSYDRCIVELLKARLMGCRLIILDRISNFLSQIELQNFQRIIRSEAALGCTFLYFGNHHQEVFQIADRAALFQFGMIRKIFEKGELGDEAIAPYIPSFHLTGDPVSISGETAALTFDRVSDGINPEISFSVGKGECLMVWDTDNQSWQTIAGILSGDLGFGSGGIYLSGKRLRGTEPVSFLQEGVVIIPDNPLETSLFKDLSYMENLTFLLDRKVRYGYVKKSHLKSVYREYKERVGDCIDAVNIETLSQKEKYGLVYYRVHLLNPKVVVCVQPLAKGDMNSRRYVLYLIQELKNRGISVIILTSNIADNMDVSDRMLIMQGGGIAAEYQKDEFDKVKW